MFLETTKKEIRDETWNLTWASAKQMKLIIEETDEEASGGASGVSAGCKDGRISWAK